jgi:adenylate cyclase
MEIIGEEAVKPEVNMINQCHFFYSGVVNEYGTVSLQEVLSDDFQKRKGTFKDSIVLVGAYASGMQDAYRAAIDRGQSMQGVEINANLLQALMDGKTAVEASRHVHAAIMFVITYLIFFLVRKQKLIISIVEMVAFTGIHLLVGRIMALNGKVITQLYVVIVFALIIVYLIVEKYLVEKLRRRKMLSTFKQYMAPQVVDKLTKGNDFEIKLGGEKRDVAVMFVDIRGFTPMSENLAPEEVVSILNEYLALTTASVLDNEGTLDKFIGDATMAVFNAPFDLEDYEYKAVCAAWDIVKGAKELEKKCMERFGKSVAFGVGVNCGEAVVGNIGCDFRMDYTAIGDTVNTAARLESNAKRGQVLISEHIYERLKGRIQVKEIGVIPLKGKTQGVCVYELQGIDK